MNFPIQKPTLTPFRIDPKPLKDAAAVAQKVRELPTKKLEAAKDRFENAVEIARDPYGTVLTCPPPKTEPLHERVKAQLEDALARLPKPG